MLVMLCLLTLTRGRSRLRRRLRRLSSKLSCDRTRGGLVNLYFSWLSSSSSFFFSRIYTSLYGLAW